jgi:hypothetical protein
MRIIIAISLLFSLGLYADRIQNPVHGVGRESNRGLPGRSRNPRLDFVDEDYEATFHRLANKVSRMPSDFDAEQFAALDLDDPKMTCSNLETSPARVLSGYLFPETSQYHASTREYLTLDKKAEGLALERGGAFTHRDEQTGALVFDCSNGNESFANYCVKEVFAYERDGKVHIGVHTRNDSYSLNGLPYVDQWGNEVPWRKDDIWCASR